MSEELPQEIESILKEQFSTIDMKVDSIMVKIARQYEKGFIDGSDMTGSQAEEIFKDLIESEKQAAVREFAKKVGDYCHNHYLGTYYVNNKWQYCYDNEVINLLEQFVNELPGGKDDT